MTKFQKVLSIFDYFKKAYLINKDNKSLYTPQLILIILKGLLILTTSFSLITIYDHMALLPETSTNKLFSIFMTEFVGTPLILLIITLLVIGFGSTYVESGLYHKYWLLISKTPDEDEAFSTGANRYFFRFLLGNIIIALFWIMALVPFVIIGFITLTLGFTIIPVIVSTFLMMWKVAMVSENLSIFSAFSKSFAFGKKHFFPAALLVIIKSSLSSIGGGASGSSGNYNFGNFNSPNELSTPDLPSTSIPSFSGGVDSINTFDSISLLKGIFITVAAIISIMVIILGLIQMVLEIFFGLVFTYIYSDDWGTNDPTVTVDSTDSTQQTDNNLQSGGIL